ncbi:hypothetical protein BDN67DRAFT_977945 [Paxillus ammoniavirescens]|nr:hypothetical protein BDN67DRAFT_977945 [Paxillus ammoniavirescens]
MNLPEHDVGKWRPSRSRGLFMMHHNFETIQLNGNRGCLQEDEVCVPELTTSCQSDWYLECQAVRRRQEATDNMRKPDASELGQSGESDAEYSNANPSFSERDYLLPISVLYDGTLEGSQSITATIEQGRFPSLSIVNDIRILSQHIQTLYHTRKSVAIARRG